MKLAPRILTGRSVRLEPFAPALEAEVRRALDVDSEAWAMMSVAAHGPRFDGWWAAAMADAAGGRRIPFAVRRLDTGDIVGTTSLQEIRARHRSVEIGATFYRPDQRSGPVNPECKRLLLAHAFEAGAIRVEFAVDTRNLRSQAAVLKLGATKEGVLRKHKTTWTGFVRDTAVFSITDDEWPQVRAGLEARLAAFLRPPVAESRRYARLGLSPQSRGSQGVVMKLAWLAAAGLLVAGAPALAQDAPPAAPAPEAPAQAPVDPERLALAREMTQVFDIKSAMHNMFGSMANAMKLPESATPDQRERVKQLYVSMGDGMEAVTPELMEGVARLYAQTLTAQEMRDALAFYRTPSGRAILAKLPAVTRDIAPLMIGLMPKVVAAAKGDYCSHRPCDQTDEAMFARIGGAYGRPAS